MKNKIKIKNKNTCAIKYWYIATLDFKMLLYTQLQEFTNPDFNSYFSIFIFSPLKNVLSKPGSFSGSITPFWPKLRSLGLSDT